MNHFNPSALAGQVMSDALANKQQNMMAGTPTLLGHIDFPELEHHGYDHAQQTSDCALRIFASLPLYSEGPSWEQKLNLETVRLAGMMHDLGRHEDWPRKDPRHNERSAAIAEKLIRDDPKFAPDPAMREKLAGSVPRIILEHDLNGAPPQDPRAQALWDADSYEIFRFDVGEIKHLRGPAKERMGRLCTEWAKKIENQRRWRVYRGWQ